MFTQQAKLLYFILLLHLSNGGLVFAKESTVENKFYLKGGLIRGSSKEDIQLQPWTTGGEEAKIEKSGDFFDLEMGYNVSSKASVEFGLGGSVQSQRGDGTHGNVWYAGVRYFESAHFTRLPLTTTFVYHFLKNLKRKNYVNVYGGLGISYYTSPKLTIEETESTGVLSPFIWITTNFKYENAFGYHGLVGVSLNTADRRFLFIEVKKTFLPKYRFKEGMVIVEANANGLPGQPREKVGEFRVSNGPKLEENSIILEGGVGFRF